MASLRLIGNTWHFRYRLNGASKSETTRSMDRREAEAYMKKRLKELPFLTYQWSNHRTNPGRNPGVYFLYSAKTKLTKIGQARDVDARVRDLLTIAATPVDTCAIPTGLPRRDDEMPQVPHPEEWWHGMKALICDFCGSITKVADQKAMLYWITIGPAEGYQMKSKAERALEFEIEDVCTACTKRVHAALVQLQKELKCSTSEGR